MSRRLRLVAAGVGEHDCCRPKVCDGVLSRLAVRAVLLIIAAAFLVVPMVGSDYLFRAILIPFLILSLAALGVNILVGYCGQISLGSGAFMAVGAYMAYNTFVRIEGMPLIVALLSGGFFATLVGMFFQFDKGFVANRILMPMINEAIYSLYEGVAGVKQIDEVMKLGMAHPMGPLQLADFIGLDVCLFIMRVLYDGLGKDKYAPCPLLVNMVTAGHLGVKSGSGFYQYTAGSKDLVVAPMFAK
mgnify:CR=1 FL=1